MANRCFTKPWTEAPTQVMQPEVNADRKLDRTAQGAIQRFLRERLASTQNLATSADLFVAKSKVCGAIVSATTGSSAISRTKA